MSIKLFQILIGKLETLGNIQHPGCGDRFQILIGKLETRRSPLNIRHVKNRFMSAFAS